MSLARCNRHYLPVLILCICQISVISRESSLNSFVHCGALDSLFRYLALTVLLIALNHHISGWSVPTVLILHIEVIIPWASVIGWIVLRVWPIYVAVLIVVFHLRKYAKPSLWGNETWYDFLCNILSTCPQQIFKLYGAELLDDGALLAYTLVESFFEFIQLPFLLIQILYKPPPSLLHFVKPPLQSIDQACRWTLHLSPVLGVPDVMCDELLNSPLPLVLQLILVIQKLQLVHQPVHVLDEDVVTGDEDLFLLLVWGLLVRYGWLLRLLSLDDLSVLFLHLSLHFLGALTSRIYLSGHRPIWVLVTWRYTRYLLGSLLLCVIWHVVLGSRETHLVFSFFVWSWLNLPWSSFLEILIRCLTLALFFVLLVWWWRQFHFISQLLLRASIKLSKYLELSIILHYLVTEQYFLNDFIVRSGVLEEWIIHFTSSSWIDPQEIAPASVF